MLVECENEVMTMGQYMMTPGLEMHINDKRRGRRGERGEQGKEDDEKS